MFLLFYERKNLLGYGRSGGCSISSRQTPFNFKLFGSSRYTEETCSGSGLTLGRLQGENNCNGHNRGSISRTASYGHWKAYSNPSRSRNPRTNNERHWRADWRKRKNQNKEKNEHTQRGSFLRRAKSWLKHINHRNKGDWLDCPLY